MIVYEKPLVEYIDFTVEEIMDTTTGGGGYKSSEEDVVVKPTKPY